MSYDDPALKAGDFRSLTPDTVIEAAESALDQPFTGVCRRLNSYINRVYELQAQTGEFYILKFYRPGRWTLAALEEEHIWLRQLTEAEVPVIAPRVAADRQSLFEYGPFSFAVFERKFGRVVDEFQMDDWPAVGRLLARMHLVGATESAPHRICWRPASATLHHLSMVEALPDTDPAILRQYREAVLRFVEAADPLFDDIDMQRIHGDCHQQNIIYRPGEHFYLIDFDDMVTGPPVQDMWMLLPNGPGHAGLELELMLDGYETFMDFDRHSLRLIEPLRGMRYIHYTAWCALQAEEGAVHDLAPGWGSAAYWRECITDLEHLELNV